MKWISLLYALWSVFSVVAQDTNRHDNEQKPLLVTIENTTFYLTLSGDTLLFHDSTTSLLPQHISQKVIFKLHKHVPKNDCTLSLYVPVNAMGKVSEVRFDGCTNEKFTKKVTKMLRKEHLLQYAHQILYLEMTFRSTQE